MNAEVLELETRLRDAIDAGNSAEINHLAHLLDAAVEKARKPMPSLAQAALWYARQGIPVFPLKPGDKAPFPGSHGCHDATTDLEQVRAWWERAPQANIGLATGHVFDVVDIDGPAGQKARVTHWDELFGQIDADCLGKVLTPRPGGMHIYVPPTGDGNKARINGWPVDYRGRGGYVLAPPSVITPGGDHAPGKYEWLGTPRITGLGEGA